jgi:UDP-glucose 4-epimerase
MVEQGLGVSAQDLHAMEGTHCVVTGGLGFIGSNLAVVLDKASAKVTVVDAAIPRHGANGHNLDGAGVAVVEADVSDAAVVSPVLRGADYVFNLAGQVSHVDSMEDPLTDLDLNARSQLGLLELIRQYSPTAVVIYASTRQVYGRPTQLPVDEKSAPSPVDVNGVSKLAAEQLHRVYADVHGLRTCALRLSNVYGPRQRLLGDHQGVLPVFVRQALLGEPITVYGDGSEERDCLYVDDVIGAMIKAALTRASSGHVVNLGHSERFTVRQIAEIVANAAGNGEVRTVGWPCERRRIAIGSYYADCSKARALFGWAPRITLADGLSRTLGYYRSRLSCYL